MNCDLFQRLSLFKNNLIVPAKLKTVTDLLFWEPKNSGRYGSENKILIIAFKPKNDG